MTHTQSPPPATFGFLTVVEVPGLGHCGGLLVVSQIGRPIEFHCTAPVGFNRAQAIMYGQTYQGFLFADQIGTALVDKARKTPTLFVTNCPDMLPISEMIDTPLILTTEDSEEPFDGRGLKQFQIKRLGTQILETIYCVNAGGDQMETIQRQTERFVRTLPLSEPFDRIQQAIDEAHAVVRSA